MSQKNNPSRVKAVGLLSGGLDSALAAKIIMDQGIEVHAVYIAMPWGCGRPSRVRQLCDDLHIPLKNIPLGDDYLSILKKPKYGFGSAFNPCIDCHIYMVRKAALYMQEIGAAFVFTGEVLGQRPMSQRRQCLGWVEKDAGIPGKLLRPLSAKLLEPTIAEEQGLVDREKLYAISGRSRKPQYDLVKQLNVQGFSAPGGGCLLTEKIFGNRLKDVMARGCPDIASTAVIGLGRYFRVDDKIFFILGRDSGENDKLVEYAVPGDILLRPFIFPGSTALVRGSDRQDVLAMAAGAIRFFSKWRDKPVEVVRAWPQGSADQAFDVVPTELTESDVKSMML